MEFTPKNRATVRNMPKLPYAVEEALNRLRVNVSFLGSKVKKIMVISSAPDEGKFYCHAAVASDGRSRQQEHSCGHGSAQECYG